jgi:dTDP-4-dehydrorhamnose 3,5-epimerase
MTFTETILKGSYIVDLKLLTDDRGSFARTFCKKEFDDIGHIKEFVQCNQSWNTHKGTLRGMHYQVPPYKEIKLVRCIRGSVFDVIIDLRKDSPTFLQYFSIELNEQNKKALYIPEGFAHGFQTLEDNTELVYMHSEYFNVVADKGLNYADPAFKINWPMAISKISEKDKNFLYIDQSFKGI